MTDRPLPAPRSVHVWQASLAVADADLDALRPILSMDEEARGARLIDPLVRRRFLAGRGIVRRILASYLAVPPEDLRFVASMHGKPFLTHPHPVPPLEREGTQGPSIPLMFDTPLRFNVSHSGDLLLLGVSSGIELGIDVELVRDDLDFSPLARTFFSAAERDTLCALPAERQRTAFYRCWTLKEAYLKGTGSGFSQSSTLFDVTFHPDLTASLLAHRSVPEEPDRWRLFDLKAPQGHCAALSVAADVDTIQYFDYPE